VGWVESKLRQLSTSATSGLLYLPQVIVRMENLVEWRLVGKPKYSEKIRPIATLSTTNPTCDLGSNPGRCGGQPATNRLRYGAAMEFNFTIGLTGPFFYVLTSPQTEYAILSWDIYWLLLQRGGSGTWYDYWWTVNWKAFGRTSSCFDPSTIL
jgi:hypothetical protein